MKKGKNSRLYILVLVGMLSAFGPFVTDFYLPALPALGEYFRTSASLVQMSLTFSMIGLAVGQLFIGPLSDRYGRKKPLLVSLALFFISTVGCLFAPGIGGFLFFRLLQGIAGAGGVVISKAIAADLYEGRELARFFSMLSAVQGLAPIFAPVLGGLLLGVTDWRGIFVLLLVICLVLVVFLLRFRESMKQADASITGVKSALLSYLPVLRNAPFMQYSLIQSFAMGVMFTYISASPFIYQTHYGVSALNYSLCFGINAFGIMAGSFLVVRFKSPAHALRAGSGGFFLLSMAAGIALLLDFPIACVESFLFLLLVCLGMILPTSTTLALELERRNSGNASAVLGFLSFLFGGVLSPIAGMGNMLHSTAVIIWICSAATLLLTLKCHPVHKHHLERQAVRSNSSHASAEAFRKGKGEA